MGFGDCVLDAATRELLVRGESVHLSPKGFQLLEMLLENRPRALSKSEIHDRLWPGTFVSDGTLTSLLAEIRSAIEDDPREPRFIRTVHGFGYAFCGAARADSSPPGRPARYAYRLFWNGREIGLAEGRNVLGRDPEVSVFIEHPSVSRLHAAISIAGGEVMIEDLQSKNGTRVAGTPVHSPVKISDQDTVQLGDVTLEFRRFELSGSTETGANLKR